MNLQFENHGSAVLSGFAIKFNANQLGLAPGGPLRVNPMQPGSSAEYALQLNETGAKGSFPHFFPPAWP